MSPESPVPSRDGGVEIAVDGHDDLGEGPFWDAEERHLLRVDIKAGLQIAWSPRDGSSSRRVFDGMLAFAIPRRRGGLIAGVDRRLVLSEPDGSERTLATVEEGRDDNRFNDAKCDPAGRLFAGTMSMRREPGVAALYRLEPGGEPRPVVEGMTISNGLGWSPDASSMYLIDSPTQRIDVFDYDLAAGRMSGRRTFAEVDLDDGLPDGLAVDADGGVWVALFGGGEVRRYRPDGALDVRFDLPASNCTCPCFGGAELTDLYVTSARHKLDPGQLARQAHAGAVFRIRPGRAGLPGNRFAG